MFKSLLSRQKTVFGIFADGLDLKFVHLSKRQGRVYLQDLKTLTLSKKLDERAEDAKGFGEAQSVFGTTEVGAGGVIFEAQRADTNTGVLLSLLSKYRPRSYSLVYSIGEPSIYYHPLEATPAIAKNGHLKKKALEELSSIRPEPPDPDSVEVISSHGKGALCVVREDGLHLLNLLEDVRPFIGHRLPRIPFIEPSDIALMNLVRLSYSLTEDEISVIVYVGVEFTRIIFMKGQQHLHLAPLITDSPDSPDLSHRLYSRLLLEQDTLDVPQINRIVLTGTAHKINLKDFLTAQFPAVQVDYLKISGLERTAPLLQTDEVLSEYAVPLGSAWRAIEPKNEKFTSINLLPSAFVEQQKFFKLSWHGYALIALIFLTSLFFTWRTLQKNVEIGARGDVLAEKEHRLEENVAFKIAITGLQEKVDKLKNAVGVYDTLAPGADRWTSYFSKTANRIDELRGIWLTSVTSTGEGGVNIVGVSLYRGRIPNFVSLYDKATLRKVTNKDIRDRRVYEFEVYVPPEGKH
jgi:hypothetical protein